MIADLAEKKGMFTTRLTLILKDCQGNVVFKGEEGKSKKKDFTAAYQEALQNAFISFNELPYAFSGDVQMAESVKAPEFVAANCFIAEGSQHKGMVLKKDGKWFFEYYNNDKLIIEELLIKF